MVANGKVNCVMGTVANVSAEPKLYGTVVKYTHKRQCFSLSCFFIPSSTIVSIYDALPPMFCRCRRHATSPFSFPSKHQKYDTSGYCGLCQSACVRACVPA